MGRSSTRRMSRTSIWPMVPRLSQSGRLLLPVADALVVVLAAITIAVAAVVAVLGQVVVRAVAAVQPQVIKNSTSNNLKAIQQTMLDGLLITIS